MRAMLQSVRRVLARTAVGFGLVILLLWMVAPASIDTIFAGGIATKPSTAICLALTGLLASGYVNDRRLRLSLALGVAALSLETVLAYSGGWSSVTAHVLFPEDWAVGTSDRNGQMTLGAAASLLAVSLSFLALSRARLATSLATVGFVLPYVSLVGHLYGVGGLYSLQTSTGMAPITAVAVMAVALPLLLDGGLPLPRLLNSRGTAGILTRQLLPWAVIGPPFLGGAVLAGERLGWYGPTYGLSLVVLAYAVTTVLAIFIGARTASRLDDARERVAADLEALNAVLAERVATAVAEAEEGRQRLQMVLEHTPVGIFETSLDGTRRFVNRRWREITGLSESAANGSPWADVVHPDDREWVVRDWQSALAEGREWSGRCRYQRPDGAVVWVDVVALAVHNSRGEIQRWLGSVSDVTEQVRSEQRLEESEQRYRSVVATMAEGVVLQDGDGQIVTANEAAAGVLGLDMDQLLGRASTDPSWRACREDGTDLPGDQHPPMVALRTGRSVRGAIMGVPRPDGSLVWLAVNAEPLFDEAVDGVGGEAVGVVSTFADVTETRLAAEALRRSEEQFRAAMEHAPVGMCLVELDGRFRDVNRAMCDMLGYDEAELLELSFQALTHPDDLAADQQGVAGLLDGSVTHYSAEKRYLTRSGEVIRGALSVSCVHDERGKPDYFVSQVQDITVAWQAKEALTHRALHDGLTGLPNRDLLMDHLSHALARSARNGTATAVMFLDLDGFKAINDTLGHESGDELLVAVADRLRRVIRPGDTVARLGGDEFVVVAEGLADAAAARSVAERIRSSLDPLVRLAAGEVSVNASIGVAIATAEDDARSVLREADATMYRAKALGRGRVEVGGAVVDELATSRSRRAPKEPMAAVPDAS